MGEIGIKINAFQKQTQSLFLIEKGCVTFMIIV